MDINYSGWLTKSPSNKKGVFRLFTSWQHWRRRYFVLCSTPKSKFASSTTRPYAVINYYKDERCRIKKGTIDLEHCEEIIDHVESCYYQHIFIVKTMCRGDKRSYYFAADSPDQITNWVEKLRAVLNLFEDKRFTSAVRKSFLITRKQGKPDTNETNQLAGYDSPIRRSDDVLPISTSNDRLLGRFDLRNDALMMDNADSTTDIHSRSMSHLLTSEASLDSDEQSFASSPLQTPDDKSFYDIRPRTSETHSVTSYETSETSSSNISRTSEISSDIELTQSSLEMYYTNAETSSWGVRPTCSPQISSSCPNYSRSNEDGRSMTMPCMSNGVGPNCCSQSDLIVVTNPLDLLPCFRTVDGMYDDNNENDTIVTKFCCNDYSANGDIGPGHDDYMQRLENSTVYISEENELRKEVNEREFEECGETGQRSYINTLTTTTNTEAQDLIKGRSSSTVRFHSCLSFTLKSHRYRRKENSTKKNQKTTWFVEKE